MTPQESLEANEVEIWKDLPSELQLSRYQVSSFGKVRVKKTMYVLSCKP
jgi:hypothetical protein